MYSDTASTVDTDVLWQEYSMRLQLHEQCSGGAPYSRTGFEGWGGSSRT